MVSANLPAESSSGDGRSRPDREPLSPLKRKKLEKLFEHAKQRMAQDSFDYATTLLAECVLGDPLNTEYAKAFVGNLQKKYNNNRRGSSLAFIQAAGARRGVKKSLAQQDWDGVVKHGCDVLKLNPWDIAALMAMAKATDELGGGEPPLEIPLVYLKFAQEAAPKDAEVNRQCALALGARGQIDMAIHCWHKVEQALPDNEEAQQAIGDLALRKARSKIEEKAPKKRAAAGPAAGPAAEAELTPEQRLQQKIAEEPNELTHYLELGLLYLNADRFKEASEIYTRAFEVSGGDRDVRDRWDDAELRYLRQQVTRARKTRDAGEQQAKEYKRLRKALNDKELEVCKGQVERYPSNLVFKYNLGLRYQIGGQYAEAIKLFQIARNEPSRKGLCLLRLGQCFQAISQHRLAISQYESAIEEIPDRDAENKKEALYLAGKLAMDELKDYEAAEKHMATLAALDFNYKDVSALLEEISRLRHGLDGQEQAE